MWSPLAIYNVVPLYSKQHRKWDNKLGGMIRKFCDILYHGGWFQGRFPNQTFPGVPKVQLLKSYVWFVAKSKRSKGKCLCMYFSLFRKFNMAERLRIVQSSLPNVRFDVTVEFCYNCFICTNFILVFNSLCNHPQPLKCFSLHSYAWWDGDYMLKLLQFKQRIVACHGIFLFSTKKCVLFGCPTINADKSTCPSVVVV